MLMSGNNSQSGALARKREIFRVKIEKPCSPAVVERAMLLHEIIMQNYSI
jgi:hypothetical protein